MDNLTKISKILRTDKDTVENICKKMCELAGETDSNSLINKIIAENDNRVDTALEQMGLTRKASASQIYYALIRKIQIHDEELFTLFGNPRCIDFEGCKVLLDFAQKSANVGNGYFLKLEKAKDLLRKNPPRNIMKALQYRNVEELLAGEDIFEIFSALRFIEDRKWMNEVFFKEYETLMPEDFEERPIILKVLNGKWLKAAEMFLKKKYHNVSHLKELGTIFVIPLVLRQPGETMRLFALLLHYFHEVKFYSDLFRMYGEKDKENFAKRLISGLRGDILEDRLPNHKKVNWMIVQRYLAKEDEFDWRLFEPHVNPEALHWKKAENDVAKAGEEFPEIGLDFWKDLDFVGDYFKTETGVEVLVSFNLIDTVMSLVQEKEMIKYLYHHQEALWNRIFSFATGEEKMEKLIIENFEKGFISL